MATRKLLHRHSIISLRCHSTTRARQASTPGTQGAGTSGTESGTESGEAQPFSAMPGPRGLPVIGNAVGAVRGGFASGRFHKYVMEQHGRYGPIYQEKVGPSYHGVFLKDPTHVESVFRNEGKYPGRPDVSPFRVHRELSGRKRGLITSEGEEWRKGRSAVNAHMMRPAKVASYTEALNTVVDDTLDLVEEAVQADQSVTDLDLLLFRWSLESASLALYQKRLGCLASPPTTDGDRLINGMLTVVGTTFQVALINATLASMLGLPLWKKHFQAWEDVFAIGEPCIRDCIHEAKVSREKGEERTGLIDSIVKTGLLTDDEIIANVIELMAASVDTTSTTVLWMLSLLARHPDRQARLYEEVAGVVPADGRITKQHISQLTYLKATLKETMRLYPVSPANGRLFKEERIIGGYRVPPGKMIFISLATQGRDPTLFDDPESFTPERWLRNAANKDAAAMNPYALAPFGYGARSCIGRRVAELEIQLMVARLLQKYRVCCTVESPPEEESFILLVPKGDLHLTFHKRQ